MRPGEESYHKGGLTAHALSGEGLMFTRRSGQKLSVRRKLCRKERKKKRSLWRSTATGGIHEDGNVSAPIEAPEGNKRRGVV